MSDYHDKLPDNENKTATAVEEKQQNRLDNTEQTEQFGNGDGETENAEVYPSEDPEDYCHGGYHPIDPGDCLKQRYFAIAKLGWGNYSIVWLCFDSHEQRYCAIKIVKSSEHYTYSARHEVMLLRHLNTLRHHALRKRVITLIDHFAISGTNGTHQCLVFEMLGENMLMLIQRSNYKGLPLYNVKQIAHQLLQGLVLLHLNGNIIHTDIKPENVLLLADDIEARKIATRASMEFLDKQRSSTNWSSPSRCQTAPSLSKTAKRKLRRKAMSSMHFFQMHRKWLRDRGIADLQVLAKHGLLLRKLAVDAVLGLLPFMPYEGPHILNEHDLMLFTQRLQLVKQVGDAVDEDLPNSKEELALLSRARPQLAQSLDTLDQQQQLKTSEAWQMLYTNMEQFMQHVANSVAKHERHEQQSHAYPMANKRVCLQSPTSAFSSSSSTPSSPSSKSWTSSSSAASSTLSSSPSWLSKNREIAKRQCSTGPQPNLDFIKKLDPAKEPCNLQIAIADLGNSCFIKRHLSEDIQTREYRAIEVILGAGYDTSADVWSAACLIWELATGEYLFEPRKWEGIASMDIAHVAQIIQTLGPIPKSLIEKGEYSEDIFDRNGELLELKYLMPQPMDKILVEKYNWSADKAREFADFLRPMLCLDPKRRSTAFTSLVHPWLKLEP